MTAVPMPDLFLILLFVWELFHFQMTLEGVVRNPLIGKRNRRLSVYMMVGHLAIAMFVLTRLLNSF